MGTKINPSRKTRFRQRTCWQKKSRRHEQTCEPNIGERPQGTSGSHWNVLNVGQRNLE